MVGLVVAGCNLPPTTSSSAAGCPTASYGPDVAVPATNTAMPLDFRASASSAGGVPEAPIVQFTDNQGTVAFGGSEPVPAFLYKRVVWPGYQYTLLAGLGLGDGVWLPFWLYCGGDGTLGGFYGERTDTTTTFKQAISGTCSVTLEHWSMPLALAPQTIRNVALDCGFSVAAPSWDAPLSLQSSQPGVASIDGLPATALAFATADCRSGCGDSSWFELHSILSQPASGQVAFAIWYLDGQTSGTGVDAPTGLLLPAAGWNDIAHSMATWTLDR